MANINERKRDKNDTSEAEKTEVGVVPGDTMASALDPFGSIAGEAQDNKAGAGTDEDDSHGFKTRD
ncbi:hypothetical protein ACWV26_10830 [Rummeliibacillus sp. JY-2-4R]